MTEENRKQTTAKARSPLRSAVKRLVMLFKGDWRFINYRKEFHGNYPINGWVPTFDRYWMGDIWQVNWRGFAVSVDMRQSWLADMVDPQRKRYEV